MKYVMKRKKLIEVDVHIPSLDGKSVDRIEKAKVLAIFDEDYKDYLLDEEALAEIERVKARHMGLMSPEEIKALRTRLGVTQKQIVELLQIGKKSWSRWETGRERPSRSMNILIRSLNDGKMDLNYLRSIAEGKAAWAGIIQLWRQPEMNINQSLFVNLNENEVCPNVEGPLGQELARVA